MGKYADITRGQEEAIYNKLGGEEAIRRILADEVIVRLEERVKPEPKPVSPLLIALPSIEISALDRFVVDDRIKVNTSRRADLQIAYISPDFHGDFDGMSEDTSPASTIYPHSTGRKARYSEMRADLGGDKIVKATLGQIAHLAKIGKLLADGRANLFEVVNKSGVSRLVGVYWGYWRDGIGWLWRSFPVVSSDGWVAGLQVFSGNPRTETLDTQNLA
jgi:hypothetical protein